MKDKNKIETVIRRLGYKIEEDDESLYNIDALKATKAALKWVLGKRHIMLDYMED